MEPRSFDRGDGGVQVVQVRKTSFQWSRGPSTAETFCGSPTGLLIQLSFNGAAVLRPRRPDCEGVVDCERAKFQWSRGPSTAETMRDYFDVREERGVSMEPRSFDRGDSSGPRP